jgi:Holliday junction resolvase RusA-like endonuclease
MILINIPGKPLPFKSPAVYQNRTFNPRHAEKKQVQDIIKTQYADELLDCPLFVSFTFYIQIPVSFSKKKIESAVKKEIRPISRPDCSNCIKFYEDCLTDTVITDDSRIVHVAAEKFYSLQPHTVICIKKIEEFQ